MATQAAERPGAQEWVPEGGRVSVSRLREAATACRGCELHRDATQVVFSSGSPSARLMLVGEQPGDAEDREGVPFVGPAGKLLRAALDDASIPLEDVYLTNAVKHFRFTQAAPGKRRIHQSPDLAHMVACRPWLDAEIGTVAPDVVVCLGAVAAQTLLGRGFRVTQQRGEVMERQLAGVDVLVVATVHPSAILRRSGADRVADVAGLVADLRTAWDAAA